MWLLAFLFVFDTLDAAMLGYVAPALRSEWGLSISTVGLLSSITFVGMVLGAIVGGRLADRIGRKRVILASVVFYSGFSLVAAFAPNVTMLLVCRILTGVGLQAMTGVLLVFVSEMYPKHLRGRYQSILLGVGCIGVPLVAGLAAVIIPMGPGMWRWVFVIGSLGVIGGLVGVRILPESIRWQADNGRAEHAEALVAKLEAESVARVGPLPEPVVIEEAPAGTMRDLLRSRYLGRLVVLSICMVCFLLINYGFNGWVATLLTERGMSSAEALRIAFLISIASVPGSFLAYPLIDRFERRTLGAVGMLVVGAFLLVFAFTTSPVLLVVSGFLLTAFMYGTLSVLYTYAPEIFPTNLRGLGAGIGNGMGRIAGIAQGFIVSALFGAFGFSSVFGYMAACALIFAVTLGFFGLRTSNRSLEEL
ncbi:MAG: hypothetical protein ABS81_02645 [Pseudonocardia sp. SCN 72-86]|nr:MAG: hypothetical protein ABS81_02645 [Pseudonocardia sp. SCN 72-86]